MPGRDSIPTYGEEGLVVTRYLVSQIVGGRRSNIDDSLVDLSWKTFKVKNTAVVDRWIRKYPGGTDRNKKVRDFFNAHKKKRFEKYIKSGEGKCGRRRKSLIVPCMILSTLLASLLSFPRQDIQETFS